MNNEFVKFATTALKSKPSQPKTLVCTTCKGTGKTGGRIEKQWVNTTWCSTAGEYQDVIVYDDCPDCTSINYIK